MAKWMVSVSADLEIEADDEKAAIQAAVDKIEDDIDNALFFDCEQVNEEVDCGAGGA